MIATPRYRVYRCRMSSDRRRNCRRCGGHESKVGPISWRGKCMNCGLEAEREAIIQLANHDGPVFQHWRVRVAASVGAVVESDSRNG